MTTLQWRPPPSRSGSPPHLRQSPPPHLPLFPLLKHSRKTLTSPLSCTTTTTTPPPSPPPPPPPPPSMGPSILKKKARYRKAYPGELKGITEELRFVAMRLKNERDKAKQKEGEEGEKEGEMETWEPTVKGLLRYLVDSKVVFETVEAVVEDSEDVALAYFRNTGLERSSRIELDLHSFEKEMLIPEPGRAGLVYAEYLKELLKRSVPSFISHLYTIYFSHLFGSQVILKQVADKILDGKELEINKWDDDPQVLLKEVKDNFNKLAEHWPRSDKERCLKESTKAYRFLGGIVRLIIYK